MHRLLMIGALALLAGCGTQAQPYAAVVPPPLPPAIAPAPAEPYGGYIEPKHMAPHYPHHYYYHRPVHHRWHDYYGDR